MTTQEWLEDVIKTVKKELDEDGYFVNGNPFDDSDIGYLVEQVELLIKRRDRWKEVAKRWRYRYA